ncbi:MAG: carboxypeptidase M32 [Clostridia bacterium]|nr:carboxypeptidase M32 [Clostridia bacterium]
MEINEALKVMREYGAKLRAYRHAMGVMQCDAMVCAPKNSAPQRAATGAVLSGEVYKLTAAPERIEAIETLFARSEELDELTRLEVKELKKELDRLTKLPPELYREFSRIKGEASAAWQAAKAANDHAMFEPYLDRMFAAARDIAACSSPEKDPYDHWLDRFEPGASQETLDVFFSSVRDGVVPLLKRVLEKPAPDVSFLHGHFPIERQREFSDAIMELMGIDRADCSIAEVEHPYTMGLNKHDVRITTHYYEDRVAANMFSVLHEGGHAIYEMGVADELYGTALSGPASSGIHESQSRFYENMIGRSHAFAELITPVVRRFFPEAFSDVSADAFWRAVNAVKPTLKRTEADELTYCLHVLVRYELEQKLMHGDMTAKDVPAEWNRLYGEYLGVEAPSDSEGCLQDMHWGSGLIGYFPTYALGNAYAAQIDAAMRRCLDADALIRGGRIPAVTAWLGERIHRYGRTKTPAELIRICTGEDPDPRYYIDYLTKKYSELYRL